jgi:hypothetical protein
VSLFWESADQETAAGNGPGAGAVRSAPAAADAGLVEDLVGNGVGRAIARELAREKPEVCRRCLGYLPFVRVKTTPGAWLANAIRGEYGPPAGYAKPRPARPKPARDGAAAREGLQGRQEPGQAAIDARLRDSYGRLEKNAA